MAAKRRGQIVDAFLSLVVKQGLEQVNLADVAAASGVQQAAIRHFVGNRDDLIVAAIDELNRRYLAGCYAVAAESPDIETLVRMFFDPSVSHDPDAIAFFHLVPESFHREVTLAAVKEAYEIFLRVIADGLRRSYPDAGEARIRDTAYAIGCLMEMNGTLQRMGFPRARATGAATAALVLSRELGKS